MLPTITVSSLEGAVDAQAFRALNERWITERFALEDADRAVLHDPERSIIAKGGIVLMARAGEERIGCVALLHVDEDTVELAKMAVTPTWQGRGVGRLLITAAVDAARMQHRRRMTLESNSSLVSAVHLYESIGFQHVPAEIHAPTPYARANVFMQLDLG